MVLRVRFASGSRAERRRRWSGGLLLAICSLLQPVALVVWFIAGWRLGRDFGWTANFPFTSGLLSHWQVWLALAFSIQFAAYLLQRLIAVPAEEEDRVRARRSGIAA